MSILELLQKFPQVFTVRSSGSDCPWVKCRGQMVSLAPFSSGDQVGMLLTIGKKFCCPASFRRSQFKLLDAITQEAKAEDLNVMGLALAGPSICKYPLWISMVSLRWKDSTVHSFIVCTLYIGEFTSLPTFICKFVAPMLVIGQL